MTLQEMFNYVLIESGQFLVPVENLEINRDRFKTLVELALSTYSGKWPHERKFNLNFPNRKLTFTDTSKDIHGDLTGIPDGIADMVPVRIAGVAPYFIREYREHKSAYMNDATPWPWEYRKPSLYVPVQGTYDVHAYYDHKLTKVQAEGEQEGESSTYEAKTIDVYEDELFLKLLKAKFLRATAHSRRAFTLQDIPLLTDADTLAGEGKILEEEAMKQLDEQTKFWLAWN